MLIGWGLSVPFLFSVHEKHEKYETISVLGFSPAFSERCQLDLPGFKNLEGLPIGRLFASRQVRDCRHECKQRRAIYNNQLNSEGTIWFNYFRAFRGRRLFIICRCNKNYKNVLTI